MKHVSELQNILSQFLNWNKARCACLTQILQALFQVRTVNLTQIATAFQSETKEASCYRRVCRFFTNFSFDLSTIVSIVLKLFPLDGKYLLIMDRTNWKWGKSPINILMLSVAYKGISIPLFWSVLSLEGNSTTDERIKLLQRVIKRFGTHRIAALTADREFIGREWFSFLDRQEIPFIIRIKKSFLAEGIRKEGLGKVGELYKPKRKTLNQKVILWSIPVYISIQKKKGAKEPIIVASNMEFKDALQMYKKRWEIETLFACMKTRGFRMEDTHITDLDKIEKLIFVLAIAFCWSYRMGDIKTKEEPIKIKAHGRKAKSIFRVGLDLIREVILRRKSVEEFRRLLDCFGTQSKETA